MRINTKRFPLVSVIVNCYNGETYLADAIKSVLYQSYKNYEIIFWDNQSKDKSASIYKSFRDKRLKYYYAKKHTSLYEARNLAVKKAKGKFISFLDVDDLWIKNKLSLQIRKFNNTKVKLVYSNYYILNQFTSLKKIAYKKKLPEGIILKYLLKNYFIGICTVVLKREIFTKYKKTFNKNYNIIGDFDLFIRLSRNFHFASVQSPLSIYRIHNKSFSNNNYQMHINELKSWINSQKIFSKNSLSYLHQKIFYMEAILSIINRKFVLSFKNILKVLAIKKKIKLIIFLLIPLQILKVLKKHFS
jgi:glycosyltransferase involved in cell wall biosynthesis